MKNCLLSVTLLILSLIIASCTGNNQISPDTSGHDLYFNELAKSWDEGIPLGNGMLGALVWKKGDNLRISLDRADLWDLRPTKNMFDPEFTYKWIYEQWENDTYIEAQKKGDHPYDQSAGPSKIPAAAIEIPIMNWGPVKSVRLLTHHGICRIIWKSGISMDLFVNANGQNGWIKISGTEDDVGFQLIPPPYFVEKESGIDNPVSGQDLRRLGYGAGLLTHTDFSWDYEQEGWEGFKYQVHLKWTLKGEEITSCWSISSHKNDPGNSPPARELVERSWTDGYKSNLINHLEWWENFWNLSNISLPDSILEKQWYLEQYKFGSAARKGAPPISLQAVWTADNGRLPPWKGDFHHDLNTQLSYWPAYSGNHLDLEEGFLDWLWSVRETGEKYTKWYYQAGGLNIPGVTTLTGEPMGGWIQYSMGPTVSAWLGHHFYLHWKYSLDENFLKDRAYPWIRDVALFLDAISVKNEAGKRKLPLSSSPEIFNNSRQAWFEQTTNYDLALILFTYKAAIDLAEKLQLTEDAKKWQSILEEWPDLDIDPNTGLTFAPGFPYEESHRHFSHLMAFHPLGLIDWSNGQSDQKIILNTLRNLEKQGYDWWTGYSFSWLGNLYARAMNGDKAAEALKTFATSFCLPNSFHVNGDQTGTGISKFTYRPFTLEGNFAFAAAIQEMLIQSHAGVVRVFPAIPDSWKDVSFDQLRTEGAFLISAIRREGVTEKISIRSEKGGSFRIGYPFQKRSSEVKGIDEANVFFKENYILIETQPGDIIQLTASENESD